MSFSDTDVETSVRQMMLKDVHRRAGEHSGSNADNTVIELSEL